MKMLKNLGLLFLFEGIAFLPSLGAIAVQTDGWYAGLYKPAWMPPDVVFGPVWSVLYVLIGLAGFFAWRVRSGVSRKPEFIVFGTQLVCNAVWAPLFFGLQQVAWALGVLILLWFLIWACIGAFSQRSPLAAWLMMPYFIWVSFAGALNAAILVIN